MDKWELLTVLKDAVDEFVSGEDISKKFAVTRAAIWKNINELKSFGYEIISKTNNGYKLMPTFDIFNAHELEYRFAARNLPYKVIHKSIVDSTNNEAKKLQAGDEKVVIAASEQTGGRGRYNRTFSSKQGMGIYFTIKINSSQINSSERKEISVRDITFYPLIAALSVCRAAKKSCGVDLKIKWPNDLLYEEKKICGILTEASIEAESRSVAYAIIGIGVNINNLPEDFPDEIRDKATSLRAITGIKHDRADVLCDIVENFTNLSEISHDELLAEYREHLITGRKIIFSQSNKQYTAVVRDINADGNLIAVLDDGTAMTIQSGEINFI